MSRNLQKRRSTATWKTNRAQTDGPIPFPGSLNSPTSSIGNLGAPSLQSARNGGSNISARNGTGSTGRPTADQVVSRSAPIASGATTHRRFSVKLNHQDAANAINSFAMHSLPSNANSMINQHSQSVQRYNGFDSQNAITEGEDESAMEEVELSLTEQLNQSSYNAPEYVKRKLGNANATAIDEFANELQQLSTENHSLVKAAINQSYKQVLQVSDEIINTESTLKALKGSVDKLTDVLTQQIEEAEEVIECFQSKKNGNGNGNGSTSNGASKKANRTSVLLLEKKWASGLSSIFKEIQNSQKYISASPGRHIIDQSRRWVELNAITWKPIRPAHIVVLNDHILLATRTRVKVGSVESKKTMATQCYPIRDVSLTEAKVDDNEKSFVISLKANNELSFLYQTDSIAEFRKIQSAFLRAKNEFNNTLENEKLQQREMRSSLNRLSVQDGSFKRNSDILQDLSNKFHSRSRSRDFQEQNISNQLENIESSIVNLNIQIGYNNYEKSVGFVRRVYDLIEELSSKQNTEESLKILLHVKKLETDYLNTHLVKKLCFEISNSRIADEKLENIIQLFKILEIEDKAREVFLKSKTNEINDLIRKIEFQGDIQSYIIQSSIIYFQMIKKTSLLYNKCFSSKVYLMDWITSMVKNYVDLFKRQLLDVPTHSDTYQYCLKMTKDQARQLNSSGINVDYLLEF